MKKFTLILKYILPLLLIINNSYAQPKRHKRYSNRKVVAVKKNTSPSPETISPKKYFYIEKSFACSDYNNRNLDIESNEVFTKIMSSTNLNEKVMLNFENMNLEGTTLEKNAFIEILGETPPKDWKENIKDCSTFLCALTKLFNSEESAQRAISIYAYSGYVISLDQIEHTNSPERIFTIDEIREIDLFLRTLPPHLYNLRGLKYFKTSDPKSGAQASAEFMSKNKKGLIHLRDTINYVVLFHEFGHHVDGNNVFINDIYNETNFISSGPDFNNIFWQDGHQAYISENPQSQSNKLEAFAEIFKDYILWPQKLKEDNLEGYEWMKKHIFLGKEYPETNPNCPPINTFPRLSNLP